MVHFPIEDRPFATARANWVVIVENQEFPTGFTGSGKKIGTGGVEALEDFDVETTRAGGVEDLTTHRHIVALMFYYIKGS